MYLYLYNVEHIRKLHEQNFGKIPRHLAYRGRIQALVSDMHALVSDMHACIQGCRVPSWGSHRTQKKETKTCTLAGVRESPESTQPLASGRYKKTVAPRRNVEVSPCVLPAVQRQKEQMKRVVAKWFLGQIPPHAHLRRDVFV